MTDAPTGPFAWHDDTCSVGSITIDKQHRALYDCGNRLYAHRREALDHRALLADFRELRLLTQLNFSYEEELMARLGDPKADAHRREHQRILAQMSTVLEEAEDFAALKTVIDYLLDRWLPRHLDDFDRHLTTLLNHANHEAG
jgi:hemerythrin-like metal-binding protein